jgi:hypothetical protein
LRRFGKPSNNKKRSNFFSFFKKTKREMPLLNSFYRYKSIQKGEKNCTTDKTKEARPEG